MEEEKKKLVYYSEYCNKCEHWDADEAEDPCNECMDQPFNYNSHKPVRFKEKGES